VQALEQPVSEVRFCPLVDSLLDTGQQRGRENVRAGFGLDGGVVMSEELMERVKNARQREERSGPAVSAGGAVDAATAAVARARASAPRTGRSSRGSDARRV
jgi:hypothetical protein